MKTKLLRLAALAVLCVVLFNHAADSSPATLPAKIIFDTDIDNDVDDAPALGLLHTLAGK